MVSLPEIKKKLEEVFPPHQAQVLVEMVELANTLVKASDLAELKQVVQELAEAQKRGETRLERLEAVVGELAEAQKRTEQALEKLAAEHLETRRQLGGLAMTVGYTLENEAYRALPELLERDHGLLVEGRLKRAHVSLGDGDYLEVNILGEGTVAGRKVKIVGESKAQLSRNDVDRFIRRKLNKLKDAFPDVFPVLVTHMTTSPDVEDYARAKGIALYYSYEF